MIATGNFRRWLRHSRAREKFVYYEGNLAFDRGDTENKDCRTEEQNMLCHLAEAVMDAFRDGTVTLVQKKLGPNVYRYYAVRL